MVVSFFCCCFRFVSFSFFVSFCWVVDVRFFLVRFFSFGFGLFGLFSFRFLVLVVFVLPGLFGLFSLFGLTSLVYLICFFV